VSERVFATSTNLVRNIDGLLGKMAGEGNLILHNFLRVVAVILATCVTAVAFYLLLCLAW
jgi:hypothetical protein